MQNPVLLARIGAAHGIRGEVRVKAFGDAFALDGYGALQSQDGRKFKITRMRPSKSMMVVKFQGVNSREDAEALNGTELFVDRSVFPDDADEDEFYIADLIGCAVFDEAGEQVGSVVHVANFGAGDLLEIAGENDSQNTWLLDFSEENVPLVDLEKRQLTVRLPGEVSERDPD